MSKTAESAITEAELARQKDVVSFGADDQEQITSLFDAFPGLEADIAGAFARRLDAGEYTLDGSDITQEEVESTVQEFLIDLVTDGYDTDAYEARAEFGRRCESADVPLPQLQVAFQAYTAVVRDRLEADSRADGNRFEWYRCIEGSKTLDARAVIHGYEDARESSGGEMESTLEEIKNRHLKPMQASGTVVKRGTEEVCDLVNAQTEKTMKVSEEITTLSATVEEIASSAQQVESVAVSAEETADEGQSSAEDAIEVMEEIEADSRAVAEDITELEAKLDEIDDITAVISDIADQTNMLALNASIEAARAGEAGEGFAVVADEVKSLAEESQQQATEVEETVEDVQAVTARTIENLQQTNQRIDQGLTEVERAMEQLEDIVASVTEASDGISEIASATDEQAEMAEAVSTMVDEITERADTVQNEMDTIAAANQEQTEKIESALASIEEMMN